MINFLRTIRISRRIFDMVIMEIETLEEDDYKIRGNLNTFNNCREQGYYADIYGNKKNGFKDLYIWCCENRNSDDIVVYWSTDHPKDNGMPSDRTFDKRCMYFSCNKEHEAVDFIIDLIMKHLKYKEE